jgi:hypothetical protein
MLTLSEYLKKEYVSKPKGTIKGIGEAEQKEIAEQFKTKSISQVALEFGIEYETSRRIYHKWRKK